MRMNFLSEAMMYVPILEGYGRVIDMDYDNWHVDPTPKVLQLGTWVHPRTRNRLVAGINLNYLSQDELDKLRYYLPDILKNTHLYVRYHAGRRLMPDTFRNSYRTYRRDRVNIIDKKTLKFLTPNELKKQGEEERAEKLAKRREQLKALRARKYKISPTSRPEIEPLLPPEEEPIEPPEPEVEPVPSVTPPSKAEKEAPEAFKPEEEPEEMEAEISPKELEPGVEPEEPEEEPVEDPKVEREKRRKEKAREQAEKDIGAKRAGEMMARIDDRTRNLLKSPEESEIEEPEEEE